HGVALLTVDDVPDGAYAVGGGSSEASESMGVCRVYTNGDAATVELVEDADADAPEGVVEEPNEDIVVWHAASVKLGDESVDDGLGAQQGPASGHVPGRGHRSRYNTPGERNPAESHRKVMPGGDRSGERPSDSHHDKKSQGGPPREEKRIRAADDTRDRHHTGGIQQRDQFH